MSGPALHHLLGEQLRAAIHAGSGLGQDADYATLQALLDDPANLPYFFLGCQGPDILFFNTRDWTDLPVADFVNAYHDVYDRIEAFRQSILELVPDEVIRVIETAQLAADQVITSSSTLTEVTQLLQQMQQVVDALGADIIEMTKRYVSELSLMDVLTSPLGDGEEPGNWWWFDALHYRKTNRYLETLFRNARQSDDKRLLLYALGHLTHFTTDVVGHPFVNVNSGGPYRNHGQRHKTGENYQDVCHLHAFDTRDLNTSKLHIFYNFNFDGTPSPDAHTVLPGALAQLIVDTINEVYPAQDGAYGRPIGTADIDSAYRFYYRWWTSATDTGVLPPPVPYSLSAEIAEVWEKATDNLGAVGEMLADAINSAGSFSILSIFKALAAALLGAVLAAAALLDALIGMLATLTTAGIRAALSLIYDHLYNAFHTFRLAVALKGLAYPMQQHLDEPRFHQFQDTGNPDSTLRSAINLRGHMPARDMAAELAWTDWEKYFNLERHLIYPDSGPELRSTREAPLSYFSATPLHYLFGRIPLDQEFIERLTALGAASDPPEDGDDAMRLAELQSLAADRGSATLGNALDLTAEIHARVARGDRVPAFNLDADRGYAYLCWAQVKDARADPPNHPSELQGGTSQSPVRITLLPQT